MNYYSFENDSNISKLWDYIICLFCILGSQKRASISFMLSSSVSVIYNFFNKIFNKCKIKEDRIDFKKCIQKKKKMIFN